MEETRIGRSRRSGGSMTPVPPRPAPAPQGNAPKRTSGMAALPVERIALVCLVLARERAAELLEGLGECEARQAREHLARFTALSSAQRQARVAVEFGERPDAAARLRSVMEEVPETLRWEMFRRLPPYHRSLFLERGVEPPEAAVTAGPGTLAERLIREATR